MYRIIRTLSRINLNQFLKHSNLPAPKHIQSLNIFYGSSRYSNFNRPENVYLLDEEEGLNESKTNLNKFTERSCTCGDLRIDNVGETVALCGWLEYKRLNKFAVLRDSYGEVQILIPDKDPENQELLKSLPFESVIRVEGTVLSRPEQMRNKKQATGDVEVFVEKLIVLNQANDSLPFNIRQFNQPKENLRMEYRYLDLRFPFMQRNLRIRSQMLMKMREFLVNRCGFVDVETPTLFNKTPGGAQEFVVPTRFPGKFYALVQSPQQFKQMLMAGAIDRYFQIARCYRDEGARPDRQPEFTQLDIEMSFSNLDQILLLIEELLQYSWPQFLDPLSGNFKRLTFNEALETYGSDQPDVRFDFKLKNCTEVLKLNQDLIQIEDDDDFGAYAIVFPKEYAKLNKAIKDKFSILSKQFSKVKFLQNKITTVDDFVKKTSGLFSELVGKKLSSDLDLSDGSVIFVAFGGKKQARQLIGKVRIDYVNYLETQDVNIRKNGMDLLWIVDMPLFELNDQKQLQSAHHPFTAPHPSDLHLLETEPLKVRSLAYDLVLNGNEIGGGSVRIHDPKLQEKLFEMLDIEKGNMKHILDMLSSGCPPHGGIALGLDRLMSKILNTSSIRDVIAFPKTFEGRCPVSGAPSSLSTADQKLYHVKSVE